MTWWEAVLWGLGAVGFWLAFAYVTEAADRAFQRRQDARLWDRQPKWSPKA